ncbi:magnesium transporter [Croceibacterium mercuriale]|uniref:Magnesium transporter n=1 Tax=Croceibacterium mercuriale TaxID=1572751 RepID=A0A0B2BWU1_9SPHN|nr:magnesium and cobalt transport protein CorA [Croceibacterium mercuriale]KHL26093.1 magnesium transporter [Croceibacterium mercuriale]
MTIAAARRYRSGSVIDRQLALDAGPAGEGEFDWIGLVEPTEEEMEQVRQRYDLHPLAVEDALGRRQMPKAESYAHQLFVIARTASFGEDDRIGYGQTAIFLGHDFIVSVRQGNANGHVEVRGWLESMPDRLSEGPDIVLHGLLDFIVDKYSPLLDRLEEIVDEMEDAAVGSFPRPDSIRRIFRLRRELRRFEDIAGRTEEVAGKLGQVPLPCIDERARPYFRDIYDHAKRAESRARWLTDTLGNIVDIAGLLEQSRQGDISRQLAGWAAILAVPTAIAGIYGMNFEWMPELQWEYGYFVVLGVMAAVCTGLYARFRRMGWL